MYKENALSKFITKYLHKYFTSIKAATAIEYGLIGGLLSILILAGLVIAGPEVATLFNNIGTAIAGAVS